LIPYDAGALSYQISHIQEITGQKPEVVTTDTGYYSLKDFAKIDRDITLIVPNQKQVLKECKKVSMQPFGKE
jgi:uncharacterized protein (UPF0371 family)